MLAAARRLLASLTLLSVLLGTLGWAHPACAAPIADGGATAGTVTMATPNAERPHGACDEAGRSAGTAGDERSGHGSDQRGIPPAGCATVAHCVAPAPAPSVVPAARSAIVAEQPREVRTTLPRGPALEPEFPPPRA